MSSGKVSGVTEVGKNADIPYAIPGCPVTKIRTPYVPSERDLEAVPNPGTPRANIAPTTTAPYGTTNDNWAKSHSHQSVLHQHCAFWDPDGDDIVWPRDTYLGFRALGFGIILSAISMVLIHGALSWATMDGLVPDPLFRLYLKNIYRCKHGSDTGTYDSEGRFVPQKFEDFFAKYGDGEEVSKRQIWEGISAQRCAADFFGWTAEALEWTATYLLLWPEDGILRKEDVRGVYDGSIFPEMAGRQTAKGKNID
ncbi:Caleosin-domain-containing protein [Tuber magnatum]|uniref:Caleosin-domain-containing protein n=1 Tax=Tuber magnatum TaxID=42249 RepID=A0A317T2U9_9PEZI|nr:Caleosin-domain-containing protein [Tuber magnatum]